MEYLINMNQSTRNRNVLVISEYYPNPVRPAFGIFVEHQTYYNQVHAQNTVVAPLRVFPPLALWKAWRRPRDFIQNSRQWLRDLAAIPNAIEKDHVQVFYPKYTSLPKQISHGLWGYFAYPFIRSTLHDLHSRYTFDLIHAHYASPGGVIALLAQKRIQAPIILSIHGGDITYTAKQNQLGKAIIAHVFNKVDTIIAQSEWTKKQIIHYGGNPDKIELVRLGAFPPPTATLQPKAGAEQHEITILSIANLVERKGHAYALKAIKQLIDNGYKVRYVVVGDGPELARLRALASELGIYEHVAFEGYKAHHEIWQYIYQCDIFLLPSWTEAFGVVYIEALSLGKPAVGCKGEGGPEDLKTMGDCIELVNARDVDDLTRALIDLCQSPAKRQAMGKIGQEIVAKYYNWEKNAAQMAQIYEHAIRRYHARSQRLPAYEHA